MDELECGNTEWMNLNVEILNGSTDLNVETLNG